MHTMTRTEWHSRSYHDALRTLESDFSRGLSDEEARRRALRHGPNAFEEKRAREFLAVIAKQFKSPLVVILLLAGLAMLALSEYVDALVVCIALFINIGIGSLQENRAGKAFEKLRDSQERYATVIRDGRKYRISATALVPGDIVEIDAGSYVPADVRIFETHELSINESALTGEWLAVDKDAEVLSPQTVLASRANMAWMGTLVAGGRGKGIVVRTGTDTEIGQIAESLRHVEDVTTPIQRNVHKLAVFLTYLIGVIVVGIFVLGLSRGELLSDMLLLAIAVAVSVIPEGLPAAVTAVLAIGMEKILEKRGLVRNLLAAETLGSTTLILTDKTGTLTKAEMQLDTVHTYAESEVEERRALTVALFASDAFIESGNADTLVVRGRPMERAIVEAALTYGLAPDTLEKEHSEIDFLPFDSQNRFAASLRKRPDGSGPVVYVSGAPEFLLEHAAEVFQGSVVSPFSKEDRERFDTLLAEGGALGKRFIAVGYREVSWSTFPDMRRNENRETMLSGLVFAGLLAFTDPIRPDAAGAIRAAKEAGATVFMLTGDNRETARSVAADVGIAERGAPVLEGSELDELSDAELLERLKTVRVLARVLPKQKQRLVKLFQKEREVVAMTGDGINDAPALRSADIGIAVGTGTEVAKEASDLVLLNDSFSIIVAAIEEGRRIIDNLKKVVAHLLSTSFHEVFIIVAAIAVGTPLPVLPVQILWTNIIQEGLLTFGFAFEPAEPGLMRRDPRSEQVRTILTPPVKRLILIAGTITGIFSVAIYFVMLNVLELPIEEIRTVMFVVLAFDAIFFALSLKNLHAPFWKNNLLSNAYLLFALLSSFGLLLLTLLVPGLRTLLSLVPLSALDVLILVGVALFNLLTIEIAKALAFRKKS
jgi:Ca2+-transporting ATPase